MKLPALALASWLILPSALQAQPPSASTNDEDKPIESCMVMSVFTQRIAIQAAEQKIIPSETPLYRELVSQAGPEPANEIAYVAARLGVLMKPTLIAMWSSLGYCQGMSREIVYGPIAEEFAQACKDSKPGEESVCFDKFLRHVVEDHPVSKD